MESLKTRWLQFPLEVRTLYYSVLSHVTGAAHLLQTFSVKLGYSITFLLWSSTIFIPSSQQRVTNFLSSVIPFVCISPHGSVWWECTPGAALLLTSPNINRWEEKTEAASSHLARCLLLGLIFLHHQGERTIRQTC